MSTIFTKPRNEFLVVFESRPLFYRPELLLSPSSFVADGLRLKNNPQAEVKRDRKMYRSDRQAQRHQSDSSQDQDGHHSKGCENENCSNLNGIPRVPKVARATSMCDHHQVKNESSYFIFVVVVAALASVAFVQMKKVKSCESCFRDGCHSMKVSFFDRV